MTSGRQAIIRLIGQTGCRTRIEVLECIDDLIDTLIAEGLLSKRPSPVSTDHDYIDLTASGHEALAKIRHDDSCK